MIVSTGLDNLRIGTADEYRVSIRFKAKYTGAISAFRSYWILENPHPGYASGWRGKYKFEFYNDAMGVPGIQLAMGKRTPDPAYVEYPNNGAFPLVVFYSNVHVTVGKWYHIAITNADDDTTNNWASMNVLLGDYLQIPDMQVLLAWNVSNGFVIQKDKLPSPIAMYYADGNVQGCGYYELDSAGALLNGTEYGFPAILAL